LLSCPYLFSEFAHVQEALTWAEYAQGRKKQKIAVGDRCDRCNKFVQQVAPQSSWKDFTQEVGKGDRLRKEVSAALEFYDSTTFKPAAVFPKQLADGFKHVAIQIKRQGMFLSRSEWDSDFPNVTPEQMHVDAASALDDSGKVVKGYLLADPQFPRRTFELVGTMGASLTTPMMPLSAHLYKSQGERAFNQMAALPGHKAFSKILAGKTPLKSIDELKAAVLSGGKLAVPAKGEAPPDMDGAPSDASDEDEPMPAAGEAGVGTPTGKLRKSGSFSEGGDAASVATRNSGRKVRLSDDVDDVEGVATCVIHWRKKLEIARILGGACLGRERVMAEEAVARLAAKGMHSDASLLRNHLRAVRAAEAMRGKHILQLSHSEREKNVRELVANSIDFPSDTKSFLWEASIADIVVKVKENNKDSIAKFFEAVTPFHLGDPVEFDPLNPQLKSTDGPFADKATLYVRKAIKDLIVPLMHIGESQKTTIESIVDAGFRTMDVELQDETPMQVEKLVCEAKQCYGCLLAMLDESRTDTLAHFVQEVRDSTAAAGPIRAIQHAMKESDYFVTMEAGFLARSAAGSTLLPVLKKLSASLATMMPTTKDLSALEEMGVSLLTFQASLSERQYQDFSASLVKKASVVIDTVLAQAGKAASCTTEECIVMLSLIDVLAAALPKEREWGACKQQAQTIRAEVEQKTRLDGIAVATSNLLAEVSDDAYLEKGCPSLDSFSRALDECKGMSLEADLTTKLGECIRPLLDGAWHLEGYSCQHLVARFDQLHVFAVLRSHLLQHWGSKVQCYSLSQNRLDLVCMHTASRINMHTCSC
jgi:hypothetical protein